MAGLLAEAIEADGLTQAEFARRVGASPKHVNLVLNGKAHAYQATLDYWAFVLGRRWHIDLVRATQTARSTGVES
jgi:transcriptional regulator with XRE-family HTH domain